jgi:hypothetical protein
MLPFLLVLISILPPIWNVPFNEYKEFISPYSLFNYKISLQIKLYLDVVGTHNEAIIIL